jgi:hypothetical protein
MKGERVMEREVQEGMDREIKSMSFWEGTDSVMTFGEVDSKVQKWIEYLE